MPPSKAELAWAAGLFEGEGCFSTHYGNFKKDGTRFGPYPRAAIHMTDKDVMEKFHRIIEFGTLLPRKSLTSKNCWIWQTSGMDNVGLLADKIGTYMGNRRLTKLRKILTEKEYATL